MTDKKGAAPRCSLCGTAWNELCKHRPTPTAADHAKFANPMTHFMYISFGSSPMVAVPADPGPKKEENDDGGT